MSNTKTITLETPIKRGEQSITSITLRKPTGTGWMRGAKLMDLMQMDAAALGLVLPRISEPALTPQEIATALDPADLFQIGAEVAAFLLPKSALQTESQPE